jgi:integrase
MQYGYCRCSTNENKQDIDRQKRELKQLGIKESNIFFEYESGSKLDRIQLDRLLNTAKDGVPLLLKRIGMPVIRLHDLRHSAATYLLLLGFNMKEVSEWLGHGDITTTLNIYAHVDNQCKRNMANKLEERFRNVDT